MSREKTVVGRVVSNKMQKTIVVAVERLCKHPLLKKYIKKRTKCYAHDENNICQSGDTVLLKYTRPLSKTKNWELVKVIEKS